MPDYDEITKVKEAAEAQLRSLPGVHAVGIGRKVVGGNPTDEVAIAVFVSEKKSLSELAPHHVVPSGISGIKTDVVQIPPPQLHFAANPSDLNGEISADKQSILFSGKHKPGDGLIVKIDFTATPSQTVPPNFAITYETQANDTLDDIVRKIVIRFNADTPTTNVTATNTLSSVIVAGNAGTTVTLTQCKTVAVDDHKYFKDWVRGGIQIQPGGQFDAERIGTLGCLATTKATPAYPQGMVVGLTCQHVVELVDRKSTNLTATQAGTVVTLALTPGSTDPIPAGTVLEINFKQTQTRGSETAYYETADNDTIANIPQKICDAVNSLPFNVSATPGPATVSIVGGDFVARVFGPSTEDSDSKLKSKVRGSTINFSGRVSDGGYGIFVNLHPGGILASFSVFVNPAEDTSLEDVAKAVVQAITNFKPTLTLGAVKASQTGTQVVVTNVEAIECTITSDVRVGQPDASFCSRCSPCCSHRIGVILDSRLDVDVALIQLDAGLGYKPEVQELGLITSIAAPVLDMPVLKRGRSTGKGSGTIAYVGVSGAIGSTPRQFTNAFVVQSDNIDPFSSGGDSGSAVLTATKQVVGILFAGGNLISFVTPIVQVLSAFSALQLNPAPPPPSGQPADAVRTVPKSAAEGAVAPPINHMAAQDNAALGLSGRLGKRMEEAEREITATPAGREYAILVRNHFPETHRLITGNPRVAATWRRNGGPQIVDAVMAMIQRRDRRLPAEIDGKPLMECLAAIEDALARYGSPGLVADLANFLPRLQAFAGYTYAQLLSALQSEGSE